MPTEIPCNCLAMQKTVETWAEELAKEAIKGGIYKSKSGKEHSVANAIASVSITRDSLKLEEVQTPESFLGNIALLRTKMNKLYKGLGLKTYLLQSPNLGLQKYTATRQVLGKMRKENAEEEKQYKAGIMERLVKEKQKQAKEIKIRFIEQIEDANEQSEYGIIQILDDSGYNVEGSSYEKKILVDSSLMKKEVYEEVSIRKYKKYVLDNKLEKELDVDITLRKGANASYYEAKLKTLEMKLAKVGKKVFGSDAGDGSIEEQLETLEAKGIQAKQEDGQILKGMLALHVGSGAQLSTDGQSVGNKGSGEKGRILTAYYEGVIKENKGWAEFKKPVHRKKILNTHGMSENDPIAAGLKQTMSFSIADAAITTAVIAGTVLGGLAGGQVWIGAAIGFALNTAVNASITAADVGTGYRNGDEAWQEFAVNTAIDGAVTAATLGVGGGGAATSFLQGAKQGAIKGAISAGGGIAKRYGHRIARAARNGEDVWGAVGSQAERDWDTAAFAYDGLGVVTSALSGGVGGYMNGAMTADAGGDKGWQSFMVDRDYSEGVANAKNLAQGLTNSLVDYGGRRMISGAVDGWDNWEGSGMKFNLLNTRDFGMQESSGLFELELGGKYGVQGRIGTGGVNVSAGALRNLGKGMEMYSLNSRLQRQGIGNAIDRKSILSAYSSGDKAVQARAQELASGKRTISFTDNLEGADGLTVGTHTTIERRGEGSDLAQIIGNAAFFSHEAYRDGTISSARMQNAEGENAVRGKLDYAVQAMAMFGGDIFAEAGMGYVLQEAMLRAMDEDLFSEYVGKNYDSSKDYSKVTLDEEGNIRIELDGRTDWDIDEITGNETLMANLTEEEQAALKASRGQETLSDEAKKALVKLQRGNLATTYNPSKDRKSSAVYDFILRSAMDTTNDIHTNLNRAARMDSGLFTTINIPGGYNYNSDPHFDSDERMLRINNMMGQVYSDIEKLRSNPFFQFTEPTTYTADSENFVGENITNAGHHHDKDKDKNKIVTGGDYHGVDKVLQGEVGYVEYFMKTKGGGGLFAGSGNRAYGHLAYSSILHMAGMKGTTMETGKYGQWNTARFGNVAQGGHIGTPSNTGFYFDSQWQQAVTLDQNTFNYPNIQSDWDREYMNFYYKIDEMKHLHWDYYTDFYGTY